ncbi:hypothetical protein AeMF1_013630 [Aphanomyces euteiches]|nr:hypothetical protein AeMF1_013630 [Aphanomyces euteiches]
MKSPGKVNDVTAFAKWRLNTKLKTQPHGYYIIGDNAYTLSEHLLVPFSKPELRTQARSDYNFYISQLRIRIEMAFGLLVNKWRIFKRPLRVKFSNCNQIINACVRLHNFCINERLLGLAQEDQASAIVEEFNVLQDCALDRVPQDDLAADASRKANAHILREIIVQHIQSYNLART